MNFLADIGGTKSRITLSYNANEFIRPYIFETPSNFKDFLAIAKRFVAENNENKLAVEYSAIGMHGTLSAEKDRLLLAPHLPNWNGINIKTQIENAIGGHCFLENDTAMVGLGEAYMGAGRKFEIVAYITVSTGVGGVKIIDRRIERTLTGFEPGHQLLIIGDQLITLEELVSGSGIKKQYNKNPADIDDEAIWDNIHKFLAIGLTNVTLHWSPEVLVIGGGLINGGKINMDLLNRYFNMYYNRVEIKPKLIKSELMDVGGLWGTLYFLTKI